MGRTRTSLLATLQVVMLLLAATGTPAQEEPPSVREKAEALFAAEDWAAAAEAYKELTALDADDAEAWLKLGQTFHKLEQYMPAVEAFKQALDKNYAPPQIVMFSMAKSYAADGAAGLAVDWLGNLAENGAGYYRAIRDAPEFERLENNRDYMSVLEQLKPCNTGEHRQFDFWVGTWKVTSPANPGRTSTNTISSTYGGCVIHERYDAPGSYSGTSLSFYDQNTNTWHQTWIDNQGAPLHLSGGFKKGSMVLEDGSDPENIQRVTWTKLKDGRVRQHWEASTDGGESWTTVFDGYYTRQEDD